MKITGNEPAQPSVEGEYLINHPGLTIRQEFAARFMAEMINSTTPPIHYKKHAECAIVAADALINALNESKK